jgi:hypothetical protein
VGRLFHEAQKPLAQTTIKASGKRRGRAPRRTGHNLLLRLTTRKQDTLRFLRDPTVPFSNNSRARNWYLDMFPARVYSILKVCTSSSKPSVKLRFVARYVTYRTAALGEKRCRMTDTKTIPEEDPPRPRIEPPPLAEPRPRSTSSPSPTSAVRELNTTRIEPDYSGRKRMRRESNGVDMQSLAAEIGREAEASARASRSADYDGTDPLQEIRRRLRKLTYGDMIAMAEQITGLEGYKPAANTEEMAAMLHRWSTTDPSDEPQSPTVRSR